MPNITCTPLQNKLTLRRFYYEKGIDKEPQIITQKAPT